MSHMKPLGQVLLCTDDADNGGVAQYNHAILRALAARGDQVTAAQPRADSPLIRDQAARGMRHEWLNEPLDALRVFRDSRPDLVILSNSCPVANFAAMEAAIQLGLSFMIVENFADVFLADRFADLLDGLARHYQAARAVIAVSHENHELLCRHFRLPVNKGQVVYYGRPALYFHQPNPSTRQRLRAEIGVAPDSVLCFTAARLDPIKGYALQLAAIDRLRATPAWQSVVFAWAGEGRQREELSAAIHERGIRGQVRLLGHRWDTEDWLDAADIFVLPSFAEGMPLAVMEAMAKGLPIVASGVSGIPEQLGATGRLLPDPKVDFESAVEALADTIALWSQNAELRRRIGSECRQRAEALFREERMVEQTLGVIDRALLPAGDYVSSGLKIVRPDSCFPEMTTADPRNHPWPYLRRNVPHNWYVDRRWPTIGWLSRDEAILLYNNARQFAGKPALEIGCFCGWSTCHLALAGLDLDVIDPILSRSDFAQMVRNCLHAAGVGERVRLHGGESPAMVEQLARQSGHRWSLIFIDGDHSGDAPRRDAEVCARYAADDAMTVFHDLVSPDVASGLAFCRDKGWQTLTYQTMQIMGVAYRGNVKPMPHHPDPNVAWSLPEHLQRFPVSGCPDPVIAGLAVSH
jgi:glycosyltransferase involved in cell wall biosynthesis